MKHIPYRQNPTVIDTSKKARPPPGKTTSINMNMHDIQDVSNNGYCHNMKFKATGEAGINASFQTIK